METITRFFRDTKPRIFKDKGVVFYFSDVINEKSKLWHSQK